MLGVIIVNTCLVSLISAKVFRLALNYIVDGNASRNNDDYIGRATKGTKHSFTLAGCFRFVPCQLGIWCFPVCFPVFLFSCFHTDTITGKRHNAMNRKRNLMKCIAIRE